MKVCTMCGDEFTGEEISEMRHDHEEFSMNPFICPDCWDKQSKRDLEDQFDKLMSE